MSELLQCYNRGCGAKYAPDSNEDDSCCHHPGEPFFHDAYKGWSCCNKKCTDFTEFLNIKGCTFSKHSNIKPPEPEKPPKSELIEDVVEVRRPVVRQSLPRPPFESPLVKIQPEIAPSLKQQLNKPKQTIERTESGEIAIGTNCKNSGCTETYKGPESNQGVCVYHPGCPIFHEGLKFWSCCQKRTTDFNAFLSQVGCEKGNHCWIKEGDNKTVVCRWDYHQTGTHVILSIYAKQYCPETSEIQLNPVRFQACLVFPEQDNAEFKLDLELCGIVDVNASQASMYGTKVEVRLKKAEPGHWNRIEIPRKKEEKKEEETNEKDVRELEPKIDAVDLDDL